MSLYWDLHFLNFQTIDSFRRKLLWSYEVYSIFRVFSVRYEFWISYFLQIEIFGHERIFEEQTIDSFCYFCVSELYFVTKEVWVFQAYITHGLYLTPTTNWQMENKLLLLHLFDQCMAPSHEDSYFSNAFNRLKFETLE